MNFKKKILTAYLLISLLRTTICQFLIYGYPFFRKFSKLPSQLTPYAGKLPEF